MLNPALGSQGKERESEGKIPWRQGSCSIMVKVSDCRFEGWRLESRQWTLSASNRVCHYIAFLVSCSLPFHNHTARAACQSCCTARFHGLEAVQACAKKTIFRSLKNCFSAKPSTAMPRPGGPWPDLSAYARQPARGPTMWAYFVAMLAYVGLCWSILRAIWAHLVAMLAYVGLRLIHVEPKDPKNGNSKKTL